MKLPHGSILLFLSLCWSTCLGLSAAPSHPRGDFPPSLAALPPQLDFLRPYIAAPDPTYRWESKGDIDGGTYAAINYYMTSQAWLTDTETNSSEWTHWLQICFPKNVSNSSDFGYLYVTGKNTAIPTNPPSSLDPLVEALCVATGTITAVLYQVPNQPVQFYKEYPPVGRTEDAMISYTFAHYLNETYEPTWKAYLNKANEEAAAWTAYLPMVNAVVKAIDTVQNITGLGKFVVGGASKRGWTTWLTAAINDSRVIGITPLVAPVLNLHAQLQDMYQAYGEFSFALQDYVDAELVPFFNSQPSMFDYLSFVLPDAYTDAISRVPVYDIIASRDEFFMPDGAKYYWHELASKEKFLWIVPNAGHSMSGSEDLITESIGAFYAAVGRGEPLPTLAWDISEDGFDISVSTSASNASLVHARVWVSGNNVDRDWRLFTCFLEECFNPNGTFTASPLTAQNGEAGLKYSYTLPRASVVEGHWTAFYIEVEFSLAGARFFLSSDMSIVPLSFPHRPCPEEECACAMACSADSGDGGDGDKEGWVSPWGVSGVALGSCCIGAACVAAPAVALFLVASGGMGGLWSKLKRASGKGDYQTL